MIEIIKPEIKLKLILRKDDFLAARPNVETIDDPKWVDSKDGTTAPQVAMYTDSQWFDEVIERHIRRLIEIGEAKRQDAARTKIELELE